MRVISGSAGGKSIETLSGSDIVRPTSDRVKEGIFSSIQFMTQGSKFLDLFAGSGQMGIEALSRGAKSAVFVDISKASISVIKQNLIKTDLADRAVVINSDSVSFISSCSDKFDIIFLDPPYRKGLLQSALPHAARLTNENGRIICESPVDEELPESVGEFVIYKKYRYGKIKISAYVHRTTID